MPPPGYKAQVKAALPGTLCDIVEKSGVQATTVVRWLKIMHTGHPREIYVSGWERTKGKGGPIKRVYSVGNQEDVKCRLKAQNQATYSARYRKKIRDTEQADLTKAKARAERWAKKAATKPQSWIAALQQI